MPRWIYFLMALYLWNPVKILFWKNNLKAYCKWQIEISLAKAPAFTFPGEFAIERQYHLHMETHTCIVVPTEDGYDVFSATQWMDHVQQVIAECLNITQST